MAGGRLVGFQIKIHETDLMILADQEYREVATAVVLQERRQLEHYIASHPGFLESLSPWPEDPLAPRIVKEMIQAGARVNVGPMAAVAGAIAAAVGRALLDYSPEVIVENGGDIFLKTSGAGYRGPVCRQFAFEYESRPSDTSGHDSPGSLHLVGDRGSFPKPGPSRCRLRPGSRYRPGGCRRHCFGQSGKSAGRYSGGPGMAV